MIAQLFAGDAGVVAPANLDQDKRWNPKMIRRSGM